MAYTYVSDLHISEWNQSTFNKTINGIYDMQIESVKTASMRNENTVENKALSETFTILWDI